MRIGIIRFARDITRSKRRLLRMLAGLTLAAASISYMYGLSVLSLGPNYHYEANVISHDNFYDLENNVFKGVQASNTVFSFDEISRSGDALLLRNVFDVRSQDGQQLVKIERIYGVNQKSGAHTQGGDKNRDGYLFAPKGIKPGESYRYWHVNYDRAIDMTYKGTEKIQGLEVYRYQSAFESDQTKELSFLPLVPEKYGMRLSTKLTTWIDPQTGRLINYTDATEANYYDRHTGLDVAPWNRFNNTYAQASISEQVAIAQGLQRDVLAYRTIAPVLLFAAAVLLIMLSYMSKSAILRSSVFFVPLIALLLTIVLAWLAYQNSNQQRRLQYDNQTSEFEAALSSRVGSYVDTLYATQGFYTASENVTQGEWQKFTQALNLQSRIPGVQGLGLSLKVGDASAVPAFEKQYQQTLNNPTFNVFPSDKRDEYHSIVYLEPLNKRNQKAIGFDMYQEPVRRAAMLQARDRGDSVVTGKVVLVTETDANKQNGFLIYLPLYKKGMSTKTILERQAALAGYVYSPFRAGDFFAGVFSHEGSELSFNVYLGSLSAANLLYKHTDSENTPIKTSTIEISGQTWVIEYNDKVGTLFLSRGSVDRLVLAVGVFITILLTVLSFVLRNSNRRAYELASKMTKSLRHSEHEARAVVGKLRQAEERSVQHTKQLEDTKKAMLNILEDLAEEKNKLLTETLRAQALISSIGDGVIVTNEYGHIALLNPVAERVLELTSEEAYGRWYQEVLLLTDAKGRAVPPAMRPIVRAIESGKSVYTSEYFIGQSDHKKIPVAITASPFIVNDRPAGVIEVFHDISAERDLDRSKDDFIGLVSHQLSTPATAVKANLGMIVEGLATTKQEISEAVQDAYASNDRQIQIIQDMLNVARLENDRLVIVVENIKLKAFIDEVVKEQSVAINDREQQVVINCPETIETTNDPHLLSFVLSNLVSNASKYSPNGSKIVITGEPIANGIQIKVSDSGVGIGPSDIKKLFQRFSRIPNKFSTISGGTGLGLYIAQQMIVKIGGKLTVSSELNKGSTFCITLPKGTRKDG